MQNSSNLDGREGEARRARLRRPKGHRRGQRPADPRPMRLTARDRQIVRWLHAYRLLSQRQLERLLGRSRSTTQEVLIRLYHHRYLERVFLPVIPELDGRGPTLYILDRLGVELLKAEGEEDFSGLPNKRLSGLFLTHALHLNEVRIALSLACEREGYGLEAWHGENQLKADYDRVKFSSASGTVLNVPVIPDGYCRIALDPGHVSHFFLEMDEGTETVGRFRQKVEAYVAYQRQEQMLERRYGTHSLRVLTVAPSERRLRHLQEITAQVAGIRSRFWFAPLPALTPEAILSQPVWRIAGREGTERLFAERQGP